MEDQVHLCILTVLVHHGLLSIAKDSGSQFDRSRLVGPVDVTKGCSEHEATERVQGLIHRHHVFWGGIKFFCRKARGVMTVLLASNHSGFDFENNVKVDTFLHDFDRKGHVLLEGKLGGVQHVRLKERSLAVFLSAL